MSNKQAQEESLRVMGSDRIQINNILAAACIAILSVLLGLSGERFSEWMVIQLAAATPLLVTSSLAYANISFRDIKEYPIWDNLGWVTMSLGYIMLLNVLTLMLYASGYSAAAWWFMSITILSFVIYSALGVKANKERVQEKAWKLMFYLALMLLGAGLPILAGWV
jgi:hypothetical protein